MRKKTLMEGVNHYGHCTVNISKYSTHKNKWIAMKSKGWQTNIKKWLKSWPLQREYQSVFFIAKETLSND